MSESVAVPRHLTDSASPLADHYVLRVVGESMIEEGICDGDFIIVLRRDVAEPGEMVVALIGDDATLKFYFPQEDSVVLLAPANKLMQPIRVPAEQVRIQGIAIGLMRKFDRETKRENIG